MREMIRELATKAGVTEAQIMAELQPEVIARGPQNWGWVQGILSALDQHVPGASGASVALFTKDVYQYLKNPGIRDPIDRGVRAAFTPGKETVVVGHSLGTVVAYNVLRRDGDAAGWKVPLFITLGSPLAVKVIKKSLAPISHPRCAGKWFNAMDERDVVSLYPLDAAHFAVNPAIENKTDVNNGTDNRHGISGYLSDPVVARRIHDALTAA
jgi:pimeloyl-ACP methyl ester carboxylesterase